MQSAIHAILLAGVHQWRPSVFERWLPRTLVPIANRPLIEYPVGWLRDGGIQSVHVCANSDTHILRRKLGAGDIRGMHISYYEDLMPRGPAGCVADAAMAGQADMLLILDATIMPQMLCLDDIISTHAASRAAMTIVASSHRDGAASRADVRPVGIYVCDPRVLRFIPQNGYQDIKEMLIPRLYESGETVATHLIQPAVPRVRGAGSCLNATHLALSRMIESPDTPLCYERRGTALIHDTATVGIHARMFGPVLVGEGSEIGDDTVIVGPVSIGSNCRIGADAQICRSILWDDALVGNGAFIDQSILTHGATVAADAQVARRIHHRGNATKANAR